MKALTLIKLRGPRIQTDLSWCPLVVVGVLPRDHLFPMASAARFVLGWLSILPEMKVHLLTVYPFQMEIGFGAMFLKMVWDTDIYQTMLTVLIIIGMYTITGEVALARREFILTQTLSRILGRNYWKLSQVCRCQEVLWGRTYF